MGSLPDLLPATAGFLAAQGDDAGSAWHAPAHPGQLTEGLVGGQRALDRGGQSTMSDTYPLVREVAGSIALILVRILLNPRARDVSPARGLGARGEVPHSGGRLVGHAPALLPRSRATNQAGLLGVGSPPRRRLPGTSRAGRRRTPSPVTSPHRRRRHKTGWCGRRSGWGRPTLGVPAQGAGEAGKRRSRSSRKSRPPATSPST